MKNVVLLSLSFVIFQACAQKANQESEQKANLSLNEQFGDYWYQGKAELTSYELKQIRYGEERRGEAVLIYVTEDFSISKQVKLDNPKAAGNDAEKVMKLNFTKKFNTGIYPYSIMTSVFSPIYPEKDLHARKITTSIQEWCGQVFMQMNNTGAQYQLMNRSYFESEGDFEMQLPKTWLEDELWNLIRLDPEKIPLGEIQLFPSTQFLRLKHKEFKAYLATVQLIKNASLNELIVEIPELQRKTSIYFQKEHPYQIEKWNESYPENGKIMTTSATMKKRVMLDYWNKNGLEDSTYRKELGMSF